MDVKDLFYNKHYIKIDEQNRIIDGWSDGPHREKDTDGAICIQEKGGYQFRLHDGGEENPPLSDMEGIPLYKYVDGVITERTEEEIEADRQEIPEPPPSPMEQLRADVDFIAAMGGIEL